MYASQDYTNKEQGGLRFKSGDSVYVLLRNGGGWCTGKKQYQPKNYKLPNSFHQYIGLVVLKFIYCHQRLYFYRNGQWSVWNFP